MLKNHVATTQTKLSLIVLKIEVALKNGRYWGKNMQSCRNHLAKCLNWRYNHRKLITHESVNPNVMDVALPAGAWKR